MTKSFKFWSRVGIIGFLVLLVFIINMDFIIATTYTFKLMNDDPESSQDAHYYLYLPTNSSTGTYNRSSNSASNLIVKPYTIHVTYTYSLGGGDYDNDTRAYLSIVRCDSSGNLISGSDTTVQISKNSSITQTIDINPNQGLRFDLFTGKCHWTDWKKHKNYRTYTGYVQISYQYDETAPNTPVMSLTNSTGNSQVKEINGVYYSSLNPTAIHWDDPGDPGTTSSGVKKYNIYNNQSLLTQITSDSTNPNNNNYSLTTEGTYKIQAKALDYENNASVLSDAMNVVVDYTANQPTLPSSSIVAAPNKQSDGTTNYNVTFNWHTVTDVSGIDHYEVALSQNTDQPYDSEISSVTTNQYIFSDIASSTRSYYAYVRAVDAVGNTSSWAKTGSIALILHTLQLRQDRTPCHN
jgi:hypothetical protein